MVADGLACATNDNAAREGGVMSSCGIWLRGLDLTAAELVLIYAPLAVRLHQTKFRKISGAAQLHR